MTTAPSFIRAQALERAAARVNDIRAKVLADIDRGSCPFDEEEQAVCLHTLDCVVRDLERSAMAERHGLPLPVSRLLHPTPRPKWWERLLFGGLW